MDPEVIAKAIPGCEEFKTVASARAGLGDEAYEKAWDQGYRMTEDEAVDFALQKPRTEPTKNKLK